MKFPLSRVVVAVTAAAVLAVPATSFAKPADEVTQHAKKARQALKKAEKAVKKGNKKVAAKQVKKNVAATNDAVQAAKAASSGSQSTVAQVVSPITLLEDDNVDAYSDILGDAPGSIQDLIADALQEAMAIRGAAFERLAGLIEAGQLPVQVQEYLAQILSKVYQGHEGEIGDIEDAIDDGVPTDVEGTLGEILDMAFQQAKDALGMFDGLLDIVPDSIRPIIQSTLGLVSDVLDMVKGILGDLLGSFLGDGEDGGGLGGLFDIFGGFLGGGGSGGGLGGGLPGLGGGLLGFGGLFGK
jgi:hypothetical protein